VLALLVFEALTEIATKPECKSLNRAGTPCRNQAVLDSGYCIVHDAESALHKKFMAGPEHTTGYQTPPKPSTIEVIRELVERQAELLIRPYLEALQSGDPELAMRAGERFFGVAEREPMGPHYAFGPQPSDDEEDE
jgi:hypothetical protein